MASVTKHYYKDHSDLEGPQDQNDRTRTNDRRRNWSTTEQKSLNEKLAAVGRTALFATIVLD